MKNKILQVLQFLVGFGSFLYLIGIVGSVDLGRITLGEFFGKAWFLVFVPVALYIFQDLKDEKVRKEK